MNFTPIIISLIKRFLIDAALDALTDYLLDKSNTIDDERYRKLTKVIVGAGVKAVEHAATDFTEEHLGDLIDKLEIKDTIVPE